MGILERLFGRSAVPDDQPPAFHGRLRQCRRCGSLAFMVFGGIWVFHTEVKGKCRKDCDFIPVSEQRALSSSGMSEKGLLEQIYSILNRPDLLEDNPKLRPLLEEVEQRLGLGKPIPENLPEFQQQRASDVQGAVALLRDGALPATPILTQARVELLYQEMVSAWGCQGLKSGTAQEIADTLQKNLESDLALPRFTGFSVEVITDQYCTQVYSNYRAAPGAGYGTATAYRIWRTSDLFFFCGGEKAIL